MIRFAGLIGFLTLAPYAQNAPELSSTSQTSPCFVDAQLERIGNFAGEQKRYFQASGGRVFRLDTAASCFTIDAHAIRIEPYVATSERICAGDQVQVSMSLSGSPRTCLATLSGPVADSAEIRSSGLGLSGR